MHSRSFSRKHPSAVLAGAVAALAALAATLVASAAQAATTSAVRGGASGRCLDVPGANQADGTSVQLCLRAERDWLSLRVSDEGPGMEPAVADRIWDRFYRSDEARGRSSSNGDGAGLGLAIVRGFVTAHGGSVAVESAPGAGSTFSVLLPPA